MRAVKAAIAALILAAWPAGARAQSDVIGTEAFDVNLDLRASLAGGERSWLDGGFGKLREGGNADGDIVARAEIASADLAWKPQFGWNFSGLVSVAWQPDVSPEAGLSEAYLRFRSDPAPVRVEARAGVFWPPISLEHEGSNWLVTDTITPSAVNSWVGEEVKVLGLEGKLETAFGEHALVLTGAAFLHDDMSGTLLSYRGWALHDVRVATNTDLPLPPLSASTAPYQAPHTSPFYEVDDRAGFYGRVDWRPPLPVAFDAVYYDNRGDRVSSYEMQTAWRTRFWNFGALASLGESTTARSQVIWGNTLVGPDTPWGIPVDVDFTAAYLLLTRQAGPGKLSLRGDWFETHDNSFVAGDNNNEDDWSAVLAYKAPVHEHADVLVELIHVNSDRPARLLNGGIDPEQAQTMLQTSLRLHL
jgi:hypothetical protein